MNNNLKLICPSKHYKDQFLNMVQQLKELGEYNYKMYCEALVDFDQYLKKLQDHKDGINLSEDGVQYHTFWMIDAQDNLVGIARLRPILNNEFYAAYAGNIGYDILPLHRKKGYGTELLKLVLEEAKNLNLKKVLITSKDTNTASIKIILANGGVFESDAILEKHQEIIKRFWIDIADR